MNTTDLHAQNITLKAQHTRMVRKYEQQIESLQREIVRVKNPQKKAVCQKF